MACLGLSLGQRPCGCCPVLGHGRAVWPLSQAGWCLHTAWLKQLNRGVQPVSSLPFPSDSNLQSLSPSHSCTLPMGGHEPRLASPTACTVLIKHLAGWSPGPWWSFLCCYTAAMPVTEPGWSTPGLLSPSHQPGAHRSGSGCVWCSTSQQPAVSRLFKLHEMGSFNFLSLLYFSPFFSWLSPHLAFSCRT